MTFLRKTWTLIHKNFILTLYRNWLTTIITCFWAPIIFFAFISAAKNFFIPPSTFGIGQTAPLRSLGDALAASGGSRKTIGFITNGLGDEVTQIINDLSPTLRAGGVEPVTVETNTDILTVCPSSVRGTTPCFAAVQFEDVPSRNGSWNYTIRADGTFGQKIFVDRDNNEAQIYILPLQFAIDSAIATRNGTTIQRPDNYVFTNQNNAERDREITRLYMGSIINVLAVAYFIGFVGILYQLTGLMATERELGISQLIEVMTARRFGWEAQAMRLLSNHLAFDILYAPGWIISGIIVSRLNFPVAPVGYTVGFFLLNGFALASWATFLGGFFRKAQLSGISVTLLSCIIAIIAQVQTPESTGAVIITGLIFPPMNFLYFMFFMAYYQRFNFTPDLSQNAPTAPYSVPGYAFFIFAVIHIFVYPVLGALVERSLYGTTSKARNVQRTGGNASETVRITGLTKHYPPSSAARFWARIFRKSPPASVVAVDDLSMTILRGELSVILGANGAGKSTTMDMMAGLQAPTSGDVEIDGASIGICPQKNVMWDSLTCEEHVRIFNSLKSAKMDSRPTIKDLLVSCDLQQKLRARSETLSGGQKRKLQLAMMLTGGSNLCLLDEVSSGIDPLSRRKIWDILLAERGNRSLLFSTHFLDEADFLSDTITVLSKGRLVARGSSVELKQVHGGGYRIKIYNTARFQEPPEWSKLKKHTYADHVTYTLPDSSTASAFADELERLGVKEYRVDGPTVEDVFLKLAAEARPAVASAPIMGSPSLEKTASQSSDEDNLQLRPGRRLSLFGQTWVLFRKRLTILKRNILPYAALTLIPIAAAGLITLFLKSFEKLTCSPAQAVKPAPVYTLETAGSIRSDNVSFPLIPYGPPNSFSGELLRQIFPDVPANASQILQSVGSLTAFNDYIRANYSLAFPGGFYADNQSTPTFAWRGNYVPAFGVLAQNILNNAQVGRPLISTQYQSFDQPFTPSAGDSLQAVLYFGLAMCIYPAFFALYPTLERINRVRALHWSNGVRVLPLWSAYTLFDFCFVLIVSIATAIVFASVSAKIYFTSYFFLIFMLYGLASMLLTYVLTLTAKSQLAAFAIAAGYQLISFLIYFLAYLLIITFAPAADITDLVNRVHFILAIFTPSGNLLRTLLVSFNQFSLLCRGATAVSNAGDMTVLGGPIVYLLLQSIILFGMLIWAESGYRPAFLRRALKAPKDVEQIADADPAVHTETRRVESSSDELRVLHASKQFGDNLAVDDISFGVPRDQVFALLGPNGAGKSTTFGLIRGDIRPTGRSGDVLIEGTSIVRDRTGARVHQGVCPQFDAMDAMTVSEHLSFYARARGVRDVQHNVAAVIEAVGLSQYATRLASKLSGGNKRKLSLGIALVGDPTVLLIDEGSSGMDAAAKRVMWRTLKDVSVGRSTVISTHAMEEADALAGRVGIMAGKMLALGTSDDLRKKYGDELNVHVVHRDAPYTSEDDMDRIQDWIKREFPTARVEDRSFHGQIRFSVPNDRSGGSGAASSSASSVADGKRIEAADMKDEIGGGSRTRYDEKRRQEGISALFAKLEKARHDLGVAFFAVNQPTLDSVFLSIVGKHQILEENYSREHPRKVGVLGKVRRRLLWAYHNA